MVEELIVVGRKMCAGGVGGDWVVVGLVEDMVVRCRWIHLLLGRGNLSSHCLHRPSWKVSSLAVLRYVVLVVEAVVVDSTIVE